jgi:hypothetical protein
MSKAATDAGKGQAAEGPMDRMMRFGRALFAVRKDELPKRDGRPKPRPSKKKRPRAKV